MLGKMFRRKSGSKSASVVSTCKSKTRRVRRTTAHPGSATERNRLSVRREHGDRSNYITNAPLSGLTLGLFHLSAQATSARKDLLICSCLTVNLELCPAHLVGLDFERKAVCDALNVARKHVVSDQLHTAGSYGPCTEAAHGQGCRISGFNVATTTPRFTNSVTRLLVDGERCHCFEDVQGPRIYAQQQWP